MNNKLAYLATFSIGALIGSVITWKLAKDKYEKIAQEEIDSVKEVFSEKDDIQNDEDKVLNIVKDKYEQSLKEDELEEDKEEYKTLLDSLDYETKVVCVRNDGPYIIKEDEFGEFDDYQTTTLVYYLDDTLTTVDGEIIEDIDEIVGESSLKLFNDYTSYDITKVVYVRNDRLKTDFEILLDVGDDFSEWED